MGREIPEPYRKSSVEIANVRGWSVQEIQVLVVEDEPLIWMELEDALRDGGYSPVLSATGEDAVSRLEGANEMRALVTDVNLGAGMPGWDVARHARELFPDMPVVYVTSVSREEWSAQGVPKSILIQKPFAPAQLITAISQLLNETESGAAD